MINNQNLLSPIPFSISKLMGVFPENNPSEENPDNQQQDQNYDNENQNKSSNRFLNQRFSNKVNQQLNKSAVILIVDDTPDNLLVLFSYLEEQGFKVLLAEDGESALQIAQTQLPDLILLDVLMPNIDGFETCRRLKAKPLTRDIPVIFLTALSETVNKVQGFNLGGVDYITKPSQQEEVLARVQTHLNLARMRQALSIQNQELKRSLEFEGLVRRVTDKIRDSLEEEQILKTVTQELTQVLDLSCCQIELYNHQNNSATIAYEYTVTLPESENDRKSMADFPELYQQLLNKIPVQLVETIPHFNPAEIQVTRLACPIYDDGGVIGNLWGLRPPSEAFSELEINLMEQIASQCAIAIRQARLYQAANQQVEELARLNQIKDDFLKTISHELKSPMSSILLATQTINTFLTTQDNPQESPRFQRVMEILQQSCHRQNQLIDDLLTLCYIDAKAKTIKIESVNLNFWIPDLVQFYFSRIQEQKQELALDLTPEELCIDTDPIILERIMRELLHNACKYTPSGKDITVTTENNQSEIAICIINTGVEITEEEQQLIFDQFYRIPQNDPWKYGGTGLGLSLVKKLASLLDAIVDVKSENSQTIFCIRFNKSVNSQQ